MVFTWQKSRAGENKEIPPRTQPGTNIREVRTTSRTLLTREKNELFIQQVVKYSQEEEGDELHYHVLDLNESSTEDDKKSLSFPGFSISPWQKSEFTIFDVMQMINKFKK